MRYFDEKGGGFLGQGKIGEKIGIKIKYFCAYRLYFTQICADEDADFRR